MAEGSYDDECMRAELMGAEKPDYNEYMKRKQDAELEELETQQAHEADNQNHELKATATKFDELNTILSKTQKKLNKMKYRCGSISEVFKTKFGSPSKSSKCKSNDEKSHTKSIAINNEVQEVEEPADVKETSVSVSVINSGPKRSELSKALDYNFDKLDLLLDGAERAEISMSRQNKQMKKYINK